MKRNRSILFFAFGSVLLGFTFWFSNHKNKLRKTDETSILFTHTPRFLNTSLVNKLLTQNLIEDSLQQKDILDLNMLERKMEEVPEIENAEVFILPEGQLSLQVTERTPLFQVASTPSLYADRYGMLFPFSPIEGLELPIFNSKVTTSSVQAAADLIQKLLSDPFLKQELKKIAFQNSEYSIQLKSFPFQVILGKATSLSEKIEKLKIFCAFQKVQDSLKGYNKINLTYTNQVVASTS
jgi:cell division protein FtsQ